MVHVRIAALKIIEYSLPIILFNKNPKTKHMITNFFYAITAIIYIIRINALKTSYRKGFVFASPYLINHLLELNLMSLKEAHMKYDSDEHIIQGIYELTEKGRNFCEKWNYK